ncbi:MAG: hypothetical protein ABR573_05335 [Candidatus Dormibacteria bacterium]
MIDPESQVQFKSGDISRLLPGEFPDSQYPSDIHHWVAVYEELLELKRGLIEDLEQRLATIDSPAARAEATEVDRRLLVLQKERFERRLEFWKARRQAADKMEVPG